MKRFLFLTSILCALLFLCPARTQAAETAETVTVSETAGDEEIQNALNLAKEKDYKGSLTVIVPDGTHILTKKLYIYSNTTLRLSDNARMEAHFIAETNGANGLQGAMLYGGHVDENNRNCTGATCIHSGYNRFHDITVEGGIWDRRSHIISNVTTSILSFRYGQNVTLRNMTVTNATEHFVNVSGTRNTLIEGITFSNQVVHSDKTDLSFWSPNQTTAKRYTICEAIHLDYLPDLDVYGKEIPYNTPCRDIVIRNCRFENLWSGIGTHHKQTERVFNVTIQNNVFYNVRGRCVDAYGFSNLKVTGNTYTLSGTSSIDSFIYCYGSSGVISNNTVVGAQEFVHGIGENTLEIKSNTVTNPTQCGIYFSGSNKGLSIKKNTIQNAGTYGIALTGDSSGEIQSNRILGTKKYNGIHVSGTSYACITNNQIQNTKKHGIYLNTSRKYLAVIGNQLNTIGVSGIIVDHCGSYCQVAENVIQDASYYEILVKSTAKCTCTDNRYYFNKGNIRYKITTSGKYVQVLGVTRKDLTSLTIPATIKKGYSTYRVTSIYQKAFQGCSKLKTITIKSKVLKSVGKNAFTGIPKNAVIKVPKKYLKTYQKLLKNKGQGKKVKIKSI